VGKRTSLTSFGECRHVYESLKHAGSIASEKIGAEHETAG
jgi:hypothetical protein